MIRTRKTWGEKANIFQNDTCEVSVLYLEKMKRCSWHYHNAKYNLFYVLKGKLVIKLEDGETEVLLGQIFTTSPGEYHEFQTRDLDTICIEVMFVQYDDMDIIRDVIGGDIEKQADLDYHKVCDNCDSAFISKDVNVMTCPKCIKGE